MRVDPVTMHARGRFWIARLLFDKERPSLTLPAKYLKTPGYEEGVYESPTTATVIDLPVFSLCL
jgi:hypothetical protein